jgi:pimeloyl-ACP methyl ester carboxylesterase
MSDVASRRPLLRRAAGLGALTALSGVGYIIMAFVSHNLPLPNALSGDRLEHRGQAGRLSYYVAGPRSAPPVLLIHSINAAASAYEVKPVYEVLAATRRVYAPDLPGFGFSERGARDYTIPLYVDAVHDMLDVVAAEHGAGAIDVLAVSLASEFAARAAMQTPARFATLALVTPTGFSSAAPLYEGAAGTSREVPAMLSVLSVPLWSRALFDALTSKASIRYFLQRTFGRKDVDEAMVEYDYLSTHQPGAQHAPLAFLSARLFARDIRNVYEQLRLPVWVPHATRGDFKNFSGADWARARDNWLFEPMPTGAMPHFEQTEAFMTSYLRFLQARSPLPAAATTTQAVVTP